MPHVAFDRPLIVTAEEYAELRSNGCPPFDLRDGVLNVRDGTVLYVEATTRSANGAHNEYEVRFYLVTGSVVVLAFDRSGELDEFVRIDPRGHHPRRKGGHRRAHRPALQREQ